jgi:hypothetical protein
LNINLSVLMAFVLMLIATAAERLSAYRVGALQAERGVLTEKLKSLDERSSGTAKEMAKYAAAEAVVADIESRMTPEGESTQIIQWFESNAAKFGVILVSSRVLPPEHGEEPKTCQRLRMDVHVRGSYLGLLQYVESVERSSIPMLVDSLSLSSTREMPGTGDLGLTVSCLFPMPAEKSPRTGSSQ